MKFSHIGITSHTKRPGEMYVAETKVWVTNADEHPFKIEWLRYAEDSPVPEIIKAMPHVGYEVDSLKKASVDLKCILGPFEVEGGKMVAFYELPDGGVVELMELKK
mgnify:CR=1 FL=1